MTITSKFYTGTVNNTDWAEGHRRLNYQYVVHGSTGDELAVTIDGTVTRGYKIAIGNASGGGIFDENDAIISDSLPFNAANRWWLIGLRRNWGTLTTTAHEIEGSASEAIPTRPSTPGVEDVHPLALAFVPAGGGAITIIRDLRLFSDNSGALIAAGGSAVKDLVHSFLTSIGSQVWIDKIEWTRTLLSGTPTWVETGQETIACRLYKTANQIIDHAVEEELTFDSELYDTDGMHSTSSATSRITAVHAGIYEIGATCEFLASSGFSNVVLSIRKNGSVDLVRERTPGTATSTEPQMAVSTTARLNAGDYVEAWVFQSSGSTRQIDEISNHSPGFWATRLGA